MLFFTIIRTALTSRVNQFIVCPYLKHLFQSISFERPQVKGYETLNPNLHTNYNQSGHLLVLLKPRLNYEVLVRSFSYFINP